MCGIIGYSGHCPAVPIIVEGLRSLEYRGYDSAGIGFVQARTLSVIRAPGKLGELEKKLSEHYVFLTTAGIGHTRWATHGVPNEANAHPHRDNSGKLALVHNGIVENYLEIKKYLSAKGYIFFSQTDTEVLVNLISEGLKNLGDLTKAVSWALNQTEGAWAIAVINQDQPGVIHAARRSSPLAIGIGNGENFVSSDITAFLPYTRQAIFLDDGDLMRLDADSWKIFDTATLQPREKNVQQIVWDIQAARKNGHKHFMIKEIFEQPKVIADCIMGRIDHAAQSVNLPEIKILGVPKRLYIVACGTSFHAGLWGMHLIEKWARVPVQTEVASEFRYRNPILDKNGVILAISQSGETADTLAGIRLAKDQGLPVIGLCNVVGSSVARESNYVIYTQAGPEISVASTKAMCSQLTALLLIGLYWGRRSGALSEEIAKSCVRELAFLPKILNKILPKMRAEAQRLARLHAEATNFLYIGRGFYHPLALEGALKLKEISYIHAEGSAAGEMKHGPIALIDPKFPTFAMALDDELYPKIKSNLAEIQARSGSIIALINQGSDVGVEYPWILPRVFGPLASFLVLPALQLFAYEMADYLGKDVDQPRNLAKSVTVE